LNERELKSVGFGLVCLHQHTDELGLFMSCGKTAQRLEAMSPRITSREQVPKRISTLVDRLLPTGGHPAPPGMLQDHKEADA
jgi:hypothetical protein